MSLEQQVEQLTENIIQRNPSIVLADGTTLAAGQLDFDNAAHFEAFALQFKDEFKVLIASHQPREVTEEFGNSDDDLDALLDLKDDDEEDVPEVEVTREEKQEQQIGALAEEIDKLRSRLKKKFDANVWKQLEAKTSQISDLKNRARREAGIKQRQRERFLAKSFGTAKDFERLWNSTLRDEIMQAEAKTTNILRRHSLYQKF